MSKRPATPPIIAEPTDIDDGEDNFDWYYDEHAGGYILSFGKHAGQKIHGTSITYLYWCSKTLDRDRYDPTLRAIQAFHAGLKIYVATNYGEFRFPFGQYRGMKISECCDDYLLWANGQPQLTSKYGIFFEAVTRWLERPLQEKGPSEPSPRGYRRGGGDRNIVNARGLDERNDALLPSRGVSEINVLHVVGLRIMEESKKGILQGSKKASDSGPQKEDVGGRKPTSISDSERMERPIMSATVTLQEEHYETRDYAPRHSATVLKLQVAVSEESLPSSSVTKQNEKNLKESEKVQARARQGKNPVNPLGKWFCKPSVKVS